MPIRPQNREFTQLYQRFLFRFAGGVILLLTTTGRKSGKPHTVGLQYELLDGRYWVGAADGTRADWYRNILAQPRVEIQAGARKFTATSEVIDDPARIADFLAYRIKQKPLMLRMILRTDGLKGKITRETLLDYATRIRVVVFTPAS